MELVSEVGRVESCFSPFGESVSVNAKIGAWVAPNILYALKSFCTHSMGLLGDEARVEARFSPFGDSATLDARLVQGLCRTYLRLSNSIGGTRWNS
jgi:hypothetical protein